MIIERGQFGELSPLRMYQILRLRAEVFVQEQDCAYVDPDGRDTEPDTVHMWAAEGDTIVGYLRIITDPDGAARIGRVCVAKARRGRRLADELLTAALAETGDRSVRLNAQTTAISLYVRHGFTVIGPEFDEDGIPHVPMGRKPATAGLRGSP